MECNSKYFILNEEVKDSNEFDEKYIYEGKSVYEVIKIKEGIPIFLEDHMDRLLSTLNFNEIELFISIDEIVSRIFQLITINNVSNGNIKFVLNYNKDMKNFIAYFIKHSYPSNDQYKNGVSSILYYAERSDPNSKIIDVSLRKFVNAEIKRRNVYEALLINKDNFITEGSRSNIFFILKDKVITPPLKSVLPGVTRKQIFKICKEMSLEVIEREISVDEIEKFHGVFMTGTSPGALPIRKIDDVTYNSSNERIMKIIMKKFNEKVEKYIKKRS